MRQRAANVSSKQFTVFRTPVFLTISDSHRLNEFLKSLIVNEPAVQQGVEIRACDRREIIYTGKQVIMVLFLQIVASSCLSVKARFFVIIAVFREGDRQLKYALSCF